MVSLRLRTNSWRTLVKIKLNTELFFYYLGELWATGEWSMRIENGGCAHLRRQGSETIFSPLTAVYYYLMKTQRQKTIELHRGTFWVEELTWDFGFPWWEILELSYAWMACSCGGRDYNRNLRDRLLSVLSQPVVLPSVDVTVLAAA
jgi:hypothetical protein